MKCVAVTPEMKVIDRDVQFVVVPLCDGELGIAPDRAPIVGRLGAGELRLTLEDGSIERWCVEGGFVEVVDNVVSLLMNRAEPVDSLNVEEATNSLEAANNLPSSSLELRAFKDEALLTSRARLRVAEKFANLKK